MDKDCRFCGASLPDGAKFCEQCGRAAESDPAASSAAEGSTYASTDPVSVPSDRPASGRGKKKKKNRRLWIPVLAIVVWIAWLLWLYDKPVTKPPKEGETENTSISDYTAPVPTTAQKTKTVMIYMVGSNLASKPVTPLVEYSSAARDIREITKSGADTEQSNILLYTGGAKKWVGFPTIPAEQNCIYRLDGNSLELEQEYARCNMGQSETLASFIRYGMENYPADLYGLVLWDHGGGVFIGYGQDENFGDDGLSLTELRDAMDMAGLSAENRLGFIGFDACLMGTVETAWMLREYADYMIASQEAEPGLGWNYYFLRQLNRLDDAGQIGAAIIDTYFLAFDALSDNSSAKNVTLTLSCVDLHRMDALEDAINVLFGQVDAGVTDGAYAEIFNARAKTVNIGKQSSSDDFDLIDLGQLVSNLPDEYDSAADELQTALGSAVLYNRANFSGISGLSVYHPYENKARMTTWLRKYAELGFAQDYTRYIADFGKQMLVSGSKTWRSMSKASVHAETENSVRRFSIALTEEQQAAFSGASYYVIRHLQPSEIPSSAQRDDMYNMVFFGRDAQLQEDGTLSASYDGKSVFLIKGGSDSPVDWPIDLIQQEDETGEVWYSAYGTYANMSLNYPESFFSNDDTNQDASESVEMRIRIRDGRAEIVSAIPIGGDTDTPIPPKQTLDYQDFKYIDFGFLSRVLTRDDSGQLKPFAAWDNSGVYYSVGVSVRDGFRLEQRNVSNTEEYYAMFVVQDIRGDTYCSELIPLPN